MMSNPQISDDPQILAQLAAIGEFQGRVSKDDLTVEWSAPLAIPPSPVVYELIMCAESEEPIDASLCLTKLLDAWQELKSQLSALLPRVHQQLIDGFRSVYEPQMHEEELDGMRDDSGAITDDNIMGAVESGTIELFLEDFDEDESELEVRFCHRVEWDVEHGMTILLSGDGSLAWGE